MSGQDYERLSLFPGGSPVSRSAVPGSAEARMMTVISGQKCLESSMSSGPLGLLEKTLLTSSIWRSTKCYLTWKTRVTKQERLLFRLAASTPRTDGTDVPSWPTPTARDCKAANSIGERREVVANCYRLGLEMPRAEQPSAGLTGSGTDVADSHRTMRGWSFSNSDPAGRAGFTDGRTNVPDAHNGSGALRQDGKLSTAQGTGGIRSDYEGGTSEYGCWEWWPAEPDVGRVAHGVPSRVDRLKCLGNAVVPQQFFPVFHAIYHVFYEEA